MENSKVKTTTFSKRNFYTAKDSGNIFLWALILPYVVALVFCLVMSSVALNSGAMTATDSLSVIYDEIWFSIPYVMITELCFLAVYFFYHKGMKISFSATKISVKKANPWTVILCAVMGIVCVLGCMFLIEGCFGSLWEVLGIASDESASVSLPFDNVGWLILNYLLMGILPAVCEELICRGVIFKGLKEKFSTVSAVILSALIFALMHGSIEQFVYPFLIGLVLAVIMHCTNNLLYCMIFHAFNNCTTLTINYLLVHNLISLDFSASWVTTWWGVLLAILLAIVTFAILFLIWILYLKKHKKLEEENVQIEEKSSGISVGKMPISLLIGILLALALFVINLL